MLIVELFEDICPTVDRPVTEQELESLELYLDKIFKRMHVDVDITGRHFIERINDARNGKQISACEIREIFKEFYREHHRLFLKVPDGFQAVITDIGNDINVPFMIKYDYRNKELDLVAKTVMRKNDFKTPNKKFPVKTV